MQYAGPALIQSNPSDNLDEWGFSMSSSTKSSDGEDDKKSPSGCRMELFLDRNYLSRSG